jgi:hypothetical protein
LLVAIVGVLATTATSASAAGWLSQVNASPVNPNSSKYGGSIQDVGVDAQDNATAVWVDLAEHEGEPEILEAATRAAGGGWSTPVQLSQAGEQPLSPKVVVNPDGDAAVIWFGYGNGSKEVVYAATRPAGGAWSQAVALSDVDGYSAEPDIAIDPQGNATAVWTTGPQHQYGFVQIATHPAGGTWSQPAALSDESAAAAMPHIAADLEGNLTAIWDLGGEEGIIQSKTRPAGGEWSSVAVDVSGDDGLSSYPQIATDAQGDVVAVWQQKDIHAASGFHYYIQTARLASGSWSAPLTISREDGLAMTPELAVDPDGNVTVVWVWGPLATGTANGLQARSGSSEGSWDPIVYVETSSGGLFEPGPSNIQMLADPQGNVTAVWEGWSAPNYIVRTARRSVAGIWSSPITLSTGSTLFPRMAVDPQGTVTAVWSGLNGTSRAVRSRVFDPVAPEIKDLAVPATGVVGQTVSMSVEAFDVWSSVASSWDFGDGGTGTGASVGHCYSTPGERTVTVNGTDVAANETTASRTITIEPDSSLSGDLHLCAEPEPPQLTGTNPPSPGLSGTPRILGAAESGSTVNVYAGSNCSGSPVATGSAAELALPGIAVQVAEGVTGVFSATATDLSADVSDCSGAISYIHLRAPIDSGGGGGTDGPTNGGPGPSPSCIVPKLAGKALAQAKTRLKAAACKLGTVRRPHLRKGRRLWPLVVESSNPAPGAKAVGGKVNLTLKPKPRRAHR